MAVRAKLRNDTLTIELPLQKPKASSSGKNLVVATSRGQVNTGIRFKGSDIVLVANAYIENTDAKKHRHDEDRKNRHKNKS